MEANPKENVIVVTLWNGKELHQVELAQIKAKGDEKTLDNIDMQNEKVKINSPVLELKALPYHLQCLYLGVSETLSTIVFQGLVKEQNELKLDGREVLRNSKEKTKRFCDFIFLKKLFEVGKKVLFYKVRVKLILGKLSSSWLGRFEGVNIFPHGVARIKILDTGQTFKVNGHQSKPSLGGDEVTTIIDIAPTVNTLRTKHSVEHNDVK
ncbi:UNVERIFIED_CONTAM: hypothetical protein Sradi_3982400 [Sesamum radiatum]|uniref:Uncharacterized protein n=1 Tax=Sesamum radiatum TaxID=300843 RepID=A0AAW2PGU4_SESRA